MARIERQLRLPFLLPSAGAAIGSGMIAAVNTPTPALVTQRAARRLPRLALLLLCAAYVLPGVFGRDPWRNADITAFGYMLSLAEGRSSWLAPALGGVPADSALLPHWLGAAFVYALSPWVEPALAARVPFAVLLALVLALTWYTTFLLARTEAAQPVAFAFGGEAETVDYARAIADAAVLALIACLGLLQLGHETTPEMAQLFAVRLFLLVAGRSPSAPGARASARVRAPCRCSWRQRRAHAWPWPAVVVAAAPSGARAAYRALVLCRQRRAFVALAMGGRRVVCASSYRRCALALGGWHVARAAGLVAGPGPGASSASIGSSSDRPLWLWFMWPAWLLALWTLWRWRRHLQHRMSVPLVDAGGAGRSFAMGGPTARCCSACPAWRCWPPLRCPR